MSLKQELLTAYDNLDKTYNQAKETISFIMRDPDLSQTGRETKRNTYVAELGEKLMDENELIVDHATALCEKLDRADREQLEQRSNDANYNSLLINALELVKNIGLDCDKAALRERLKPFENDRVAISAIKASIGANTFADPKKKNRGNFGKGSMFDVIPKDNTGEPQKHVAKVINTYTDICEAALTELRTGNVSGFNTLMMIDGALPYVMACNDDLTAHNDVVVMDPDEVKKEKAAREAEEKRKNPPMFSARTNGGDGYAPSFNFGFTKVRGTE